MSLDVKLIGDSGFKDGLQRQVDVHPFEVATGKHSGLVVLNHPFLELAPNLVPFLNDTYGNQMNQNVTFGGTPELIFNGQSTSADSGTTDGAATDKLIESGQNFTSTVTVGMGVFNSTDDTYALVDAVDSDTQLAISADIMASGEAYTVGNFWIPVAGAGAWDFSDSGKVTITAANNNDSVVFNDGGTIDMSGYTAITGKIDLDTYNPANHSMLMQFGLAGTLLGNSVDLNDYIDTGNFAEQSFVIPKADLGIESLTVDEMTLAMTRSGGSKATIKFDDFQIEQTGSPAVFKAFAPNGKTFHATKLKFLFVDALAATLADATMPALSYNKILDVSALTNGIVVQIVRGGNVDAGIVLHQLSDLVSIGAEIKELTSDGTNTMLSLELEFSEPVILKANGETTDFISVTINDDLSGLLLFTGLARGSFVI